MRIIIAGRPGSGKGTQAARLSAALGVTHISSGHLLRAAIRDKTHLGQRVGTFVETGRLVPDFLIAELMTDRLGRSDVNRNGFILDGYPRTLEQLRALMAWLRPDQIDAAIELDVPESVIVDRLSSRGRSDDITPAVRARLEEFDRSTEPVLRWLEEQGLLRRIAGDKPLDEVSADLLSFLVHLREPSGR